MSSGKYLTLVKTTLLTGQSGVTVVASLPTSPSRDVTANIPIVLIKLNFRHQKFKILILKTIFWYQKRISDIRKFSVISRIRILNIRSFFFNRSSFKNNNFWSTFCNLKKITCMLDIKYFNYLMPKDQILNFTNSLGFSDIIKKNIFRYMHRSRIR